MSCKKCEGGYWACAPDSPDPCEAPALPLTYEFVFDKYVVVEVRKTGGGDVRVRLDDHPPTHGPPPWDLAGAIGYHVFKGIDENGDCVAAKLEPFEVPDPTA